MKRHGNLWDKIISPENLEVAFEKAARGKKWQSKVQKALRDKVVLLEQLHIALKNKTFTTSSYRTKRIFEPKQRDIYILPFYPDRIVQHAIMNVLEPIWDNLLIYDSYACRKDKGQHKGSLRCMEFVRRNKYCLKCDISKFYPSVNHKILSVIIRKKIKCKNTLWLLDNIINSIDGDTNVPIGNYLSQWFGNIYMNELDSLLKHKYKVKDYIRYCDDFILFSNDKEFLRKLRVVIKEQTDTLLSLRLSKCELFPTSQGVDFLGYRHFPNGKILVRKSTSKRIKKRLKSLPYLMKHHKISKNSARSVIASTKGWLKWAKTYHFRLHLKLEELEKRIGDYDMKGFPKKLNSKDDYYYIKEHFEESQWKPKWEALLSNRKNWFATKTLKEGAKGRTDSTHYVETYKNDDDTEVNVQYELRDDISSDFFRYHFTEEEVQKALK